MDKFSKALNDYYFARHKLEETLKELNKQKIKTRKFLKAENQKLDCLIAFEKENSLNKEDVVQEWNENVVPLTMMPINQIRQKHAILCKELKKKVYELNKKMSEAFKILFTLQKNS